MYADDLILLSPSVKDLQGMYNICAKIFQLLDLPIHVSKCHCIRIGPRFKSTCSPIKLLNKPIEWVDSIEYLGVTICKAQYFKCSMSKAKSKFFRSANAILGKLGSTSSVEVILKLVKTNSISALLYGTCALSLTEPEIKDLEHAYSSLFSKLFKVSDKKSILQCQYYFGYWPIRLIYEYNRYNYLNKLYNSGRLIHNWDLDITDFIEYRFLASKYGLTSCDSIAKIRFRVWNHFENSINSGKCV